MQAWQTVVSFTVVILLLFLTDVSTETSVGGVYSSNRVLTLANSPYAVNQDLTVSHGTTLTIEAGVQLNFQARVRLVVNGTLKAVGSRDKRIVMYHNATVGVRSEVLRLVGGKSPREGRIEVYDSASGNWGTVCDDFWNANNAKVVCRHLGFSDPFGSDYSTKRFGAGSGDIGLSNVDCDGVENSLLDCRSQKWNNSRCKHTEDVGVVCGEESIGFWGGITFVAGGSTMSTTVNGAKKYSTSSVLEHVQILHAGIVPDTVRRSQPDENVPAVSVTAATPLMRNVTILHCRLTGIQMNDVHGDVDFQDLTVLNCSGVGLTGSSSGRVNCLRCHVENCTQGGINMNRISLELSRPGISVPTYSFDHPETTSGDKKSYFVGDSGVYITFTQASRSSSYYFRVLETSPGYGLTVSFDRFRLTGSYGYLRVIDGYTGYGYLHRSSSSQNQIKPDDFTADYHQLVFYFDPYYSSDLTGDINAYISRHRLESRQVDFLECSTIRSGNSMYGLRFQGFLGSVLVAGHQSIDNERGGISITGQGNSVEIVSSRVEYGLRDYTSSYGIFLNGFFSAMRMSQSRVSDHRYNVYLYNYGAGNVSVVDNAINGSRSNSGMKSIYYGLYVYMYEQSSYNWKLPKGRTLAVEGNVVTRVGTSEQTSYTIRFYVYRRYELTDSVSIKDNSFTQNGGTFYYYENFYTFGAKGVTISGNRFEDNDVGSGQQVASFYLYSSYMTSRTVVEQNCFMRNRGQSVVLMTPSASFRSSHQVGDILFFRNNTLKDNFVYKQSSSSKESPNSVFEVTSSVYLQVRHNVFDNPNSSYEVGVRTQVASSLDKIDFTRNFWGTKNEIVIQKRIYDFDDSSYLATAEYFPFLLSANPSDEAGSSHPRNYPPLVSPSGEIGGQLTTALTLTASGSPYLMTRDVTVLPSGILTIEAGVVIEVQSDTGILVEGSLMSMGTMDSPIIIRPQSVPENPASSDGNIRITEGSYFSDWEYGILQIQQDGEWRSICLPTNQSGDYRSLDKLADSSCKRLGYSYGYYSYGDWYPELGTPVIRRFSCPSNATDLDHCSFTSGLYAPSFRCLTRFWVDCGEKLSGAVRPSGRWVGLRFSPTSTIAVSGNESVHTLPTSVLLHTVIQGAGLWTNRNVPAVKALFRSPTFVNVTIRDSSSTALSLEYLHEEASLTGVFVDGGRGNGISVTGPRTRNLTLHGVTVRNVTGTGIYVYPSSSSLRSSTNYQSICSTPVVLNVDTENGTYVGLHQDDHLAGIVCSVVLQGPPNTVLSLTLLSVQLYSDDRLEFKNGPTSSSNTFATYSGQNTNSIDDSLESSGNSVYVRISTGAKSGAPGFAVYAIALSTKPGRPQTQIVGTEVFSSNRGFYFGNTRDDVMLTNVKSENSSGYGILISSHYGLFSVKNSIIRNSRSYGLYVSYSRGGSIELVDNEISGSSNHGLYFYRNCDYNNQYLSHIVQSNIISGGGNAGMYLYDYSYRSSARCKWDIQNNVFDSNRDGLVVTSYSYFFTNYFNNITVSGNSFQNHTRYGLQVDRTQGIDFLIDGNTFVGHHGSAGGSMWLLADAQDLKVTNNLFHGNAGKYVVLLSPYSFTASPFVFKNNRLVDNLINSTENNAVDFRYSAVAIVSTSSQVIMQDNEFNNPKSQYELGIHLYVQSSSESTVNVSGNYWGTTSEAIIRDRICDFGCCARLAAAEFFPYLTSPLGPAVSLSVFRDTGILRPNGLLRGRVVTSTTIPVSGSPYVVVGDISVLPGNTLTIEAGVELRFLANTGILVEGRLSAEGTENQPIKFVDNSLTLLEAPAVVGSSGNIRLVGGVNSDEGIVEVYHNGTWGSLCALQDENDRFYSIDHNYYLSRAVCREFGYSDAQWLWPLSRYVNSSYPGDAWLEHLICRGSESSLKQCVNYVLKRSTCHLGALQVVCSTNNNQQTNLRKQSWLHWSGIRFSQSTSQTSLLRHVFLSGAGFANAERIPAIQSVGHKLELTDVFVTENAWTGVDIINGPAPLINRLNTSLNQGTGLRLSNTLASNLNGVTAIGNRGHGVALARDGFLQSMWNYPVKSGVIVDMCVQSSVSASSPFYLRVLSKSFISGRFTSSYVSKTCSLTVRADANHVLSFDIMAVQFQYFSSYVNIDGQTAYTSRRIQFFDQSLHYVTKGNSASVSAYAYLYRSSFEFNSLGDYLLIYVQQHPVASSVASHAILGGWFVSNLLSGVAFNSSRSTYTRSSVTISSCTISNNAWNGIDGNTSNGGSTGFGSVIRDIKIKRNVISGNGQFTTASFKGRAAGIALYVDNADIAIQNNGIVDNRGGAISLNLDTTRTESTSAFIFDNRIARNSQGGTIGVNGASGSSGPRVDIRSNIINHNSAGILHDTLAITNIAATVVDNVFYNNTGRHVTYWETGQRSSISDQTFENNTLYLNVGQTPNYRWTIYAVGVGASYTKNVFTNPANKYEFASGSDLGQGSHDARENWWGSRHLSQVEKRVRDKIDVSSLAAASVAPVETISPWNDNGGCQFGWTLEEEYDFYCYLYVKEAADWDTASQFCQKESGNLGASHDISVDGFLKGLFPLPPTSLTNAGAWLGLHHNGMEWLWSDGSDVDYIAWNVSGQAGDCLKLTPAGWTKEDCTSRLPFFCSKPPADECPNACSQHGQCDSATRTCSCFKGWRGEDCSDFHCNDVNDCSGYGTCVGPNQCRCRVGWKGRACTTTYCNLYTTCHSCSQQPGCGWCDGKQMCIPGLGLRPDKEECGQWFYYSCYSPPSKGSSTCSNRIKEIGCSSPCDISVATSNKETCQHCHDIEFCYVGNSSSCSGWNESQCPYGRVTPDYGLGPDAPKIPSHLPNGKSDFRDKRSAGGKPVSDRRGKYVDLHPDVRVVDSATTKIYRLLGNADVNYYITKPSLKNVFTGQILASRQSGGILDKILAMSNLGGGYQIFKAGPATLEEVVKYADFIGSVQLEDVEDETAVELMPDVDAVKAIASSPIPMLPDGKPARVVPSSSSIFKCKNSADGNVVISLPSNQANSLSPELYPNVVSEHSNGFLEEVVSIASAGSHTIVHTKLATCSLNPDPPSVKLEVKTTASPSSVVSPSVTGVGGMGVEGIQIFENVLPSGLELSVGDVIPGRPSGPVAGRVVDFYGSYDDSATFLVLKPSSGVGSRPCDNDDGLGIVNIGADTAPTPGDDLTPKWCNSTDARFFYHEILKPKISNSGLGTMSTEAIISYSPQVQMTFRTNQTSPFVSKMGFSFDGPMHIGTNVKFSLSSSSSSGNLAGPTDATAVPVNGQSRPFCIEIGSLCVRGQTTFSAQYSYSLTSSVNGPSTVSFTYESESRGNASLGTIWRNGVGAEYVKKANLVAIQDLVNHPQYSSSFDSYLSPTFGLEWPTSYKNPSFIQSSIPNFLESVLSSSPSLYPPSSYSMEVSPSLKGYVEAERCYKGCDFGKKLLASSWAGVHKVKAMSSIDLLYYNHLQSFERQNSDFVDVIVGDCRPLDNENDCPCECPQKASCTDAGNGVKVCTPCACAGSPGCDCSPCPAGTVETEISSSFVDNPEPKCECKCSDFEFSDFGINGTCQCGCQCADLSESTFGPDGHCQCGCKCKNCQDSILGPSGCICPDDKCPTCPEGLEPVWQDCTCSCQAKQGRGGLPPVCSDGWKGPNCDVPDCSPWPFCSDNGVCVVPSGDEADKKPYCVCNEQWIGRGCQFARPRPGGGDPHLQTLDGFSYDFFDIGEFWYCKSVANDFGVSTRFFKYKRASLIGAVAVKAGPSIVTISTPHSPQPKDLPILRINGVVVSISDGLMLNLAQQSVHLETVLFSNSTSEENVALFAFQFSNGVSLSVDVRYSAVMQRQFINILFAPVASFKRKTEGLCGLMDGDTSNDLVGSDGLTYVTNKVIDFAKTWRISTSFDGSGLNGTWSWNHSNFHKNDKLDSSYTDPSFVPIYTINDIDPVTRKLAEDLCKQQSLDGVLLTECIFDVAITNDTSLAQQETYKTGCPTQCSGKGRCVNSTCVCLPGWFGDECNLGSCANCSVNGDCVSGFCRCHFGWEGALCDKPATCYGVSNCTNPSQGACKSHDVCECTAGFTGSACSEVADCSRLGDCKSHGVCVDHDECKCNLGWAGVDCSVYSCETVGYCSNHGSCVGFDKCQCDDGWGGSSCAFPTCSNVSDCSGNGDCTAPDACNCYAGFSGKDCATPTNCPELDDCSGNGVCQARTGKEYCLCYAGYKGENCSVASCTGQNDCSGKGSCIEVDLCQCSYGFTGSDCSQFSCEAKKFCSGHGKCLKLDVCTCDSKWKGPECNVPDCGSVNNCGNASTGACVGPDTCQCTAAYDGVSCDQLASLNQYAPTFNSSSVSIVVPVTAPLGYVVASLPAIDMDSGKNGRFTYSLSSSSGRHSLFKVNSQSGEISTVSSLKSQSGSVFSITSTATDGGIPSLSGSVDISIIVAEPNLHCPVFVGLPSSVDVQETATSGTLVVQLTATDKDSSASPNGIVKYSLGMTSPSEFQIDSVSGRISVSKSLTDDSYTLDVIASDEGQPQCHTKGAVKVNVLSSNHAPSCVPSSLTMSVPYTTSPSTVLFSLEATDSDSGSDGALTYSLTNFKSTVINGSAFTLGGNDSTKADVILRSSLPMPSGAFYTASFTVVARDQSSRPKSCNFYLTVSVAHQFEFVSRSLVAQLSENVPVQSTVSTTPPLSVRTTLTPSSITYSLHNADLLPFSVHKTTGVLSLQKSLDYERQKEYNVSVIAVTSAVPGAVTVATVRVSVTNVNDNAPKFPQSRYLASVDEDAESGDLVLTLTATDPDVGTDRSQIEYKLASVTPSGFKNTFEIRSSSSGIGVYLSNVASLNYQVARKYNLVIKASDKRNPSFYTEVTVIITLNEAKAFRPLFVHQQYNVDLKESAPDGSSVLQVEAFVDGQSSSEVSYSIKSQVFKSGKTTNAFSMTTNDGIIKVFSSGELDYERANEINIVAVASVTKPVLRTSEATVVVSLLDVNDNSPIFSSEQYDASVSLDSVTGFVFINVTATDRDSGSNGEVVYSMSSDAPQEFFVIDSSSGAVSLDRELDSTAYEQYELTVTATDKGTPPKSGSSTILLKVTCSSSGLCPLEEPKGKSISLGIIIGAAVGGAALVLVVVLIVVLVKKSKGGKQKKYFDHTPASVRETTAGLDILNPVYKGDDGEPVYTDMTSVGERVDENPYTNITESQRMAGAGEPLYDAAD
eukprot:m.13434 g.13434  ORF g.13434 m.13434 type:complete len:5185 (+) comp24805_c0_seq1:361-15915(+)